MMVTWGEDSFSTTSSEPLRNRGYKVSCNEHGACATFRISAMKKPPLRLTYRFGSSLTLPRFLHRPTHTGKHLQHTRNHHT